MTENRSEKENTIHIPFKSKSLAMNVTLTKMLASLLQDGLPHYFFCFTSDTFLHGCSSIMIRIIQF